MLSAFFDFMPLFVVRWAALRYCEVFPFPNGEKWVMARPGVMFRHVELEARLSAKFSMVQRSTPPPTVKQEAT